MDADGTADARRSDARVEVVGGGTVAAEQLAAVVVALTPAAADPPDDAGAATPAWARAGLLEGVGLLPPTRPSDLQQVAVLG